MSNPICKETYWECPGCGWYNPYTKGNLAGNYKCANCYYEYVLNMKGNMCPYKLTLCQEGYCSSCTIPSDD